MLAAMREQLLTMDERYAQCVEVRELRDDMNRLADAVRNMQCGGQQQYVMPCTNNHYPPAVAPPVSAMSPIPVPQYPRSGKQVYTPGALTREDEVYDGSYTMLRPSRYGGPSFAPFQTLAQTCQCPTTCTALQCRNKWRLSSPIPSSTT